MKAPSSNEAKASSSPKKSSAFKSSSAVATVIINVCHCLTFAPLLLFIVLQDVHFKLAVVLNTAICICLAVGNFCFYRMRVIQAYPKVLDMFLLVLYGSLIAVAYTQTAWLLRWANVLHHGAVACFMWLSILVPCWPNFALQGFRDCLPEPMCRLQSTHTAALHAAQGWAVSLTTMALVALAPVLTNRTHQADPVYIICDYVVGLLALAMAALTHGWYKRRALDAAELYSQGSGCDTGGPMFTRAVVAAFAPAGEHDTYQLHADATRSSSGMSSSCSGENNTGSNNIRDLESGHNDSKPQDPPQGGASAGSTLAGSTLANMLWFPKKGKALRSANT